ncbi:MAG: RNA 2',3'-cyclic phosphodiesterase [Candidatus Pacearchaeota archaeon]|nr:RNA 2',3'-cyclic phosphodiesterase [Candidatus Pacearchaeota archaeon]
MRCFIAIEISEKAKEELLRVQKEFKGIIEGKFVEKENFHLTLKFLGEVSNYEINQLKQELRKIRFNKFIAKLGSIGYFTPSFARVLWVSLEPKDNFVELHEKVESLLRNFNIKKEKRKFMPHVTIARIKNIKKKEKFFEKIEKIKIEPIDFEISSFVLNKSVLTEKGPIYEKLFEFYAV